MSHVTCHVSRVTCHVSHVICHMSHVMCHMSQLFFCCCFFWTKWWSLAGEGLLSTGPTPSSFKRPGVAGSVLHHLRHSLINSVRQPFPPKLLPSTFNPKWEELGSWNFERMFIPHYVSCVMTHVSCVTCHMSHVTCHMSPVICPLSHVNFFPLKTKTNKKLLLSFKKLDKVVDLVGGGPTPSSFLTVWGILFWCLYLDTLRDLVSCVCGIFVQWLAGTGQAILLNPPWTIWGLPCVLTPLNNRKTVRTIEQRVASKTFKKSSIQEALNLLACGGWGGGNLFIYQARKSLDSV